MSSRGTVTINGHATDEEYDTVRKIYDAKVLKGRDNRHNLPDYSHSANSKYIQENSDGSFRALRIYGSDNSPILEIAYHAEPKITGNRHEKVLHYHTFTKELERIWGGEISNNTNSDILYKYRKYLEEYGL